MKKIFTISEYDVKNNRSVRNYRFFADKKDALTIYASIGYKYISMMSDESVTTLYHKDLKSFIYIREQDLE